MALSINVIEVLNDQYQLSALPLGESVKIRLSALPDMSTIEKYVSIVNTDSSEDVPNFSSLPFLIQDEFQYKTIESDYSIEADGDTFVLTVSPIGVLKPESVFYLAIHKNLAPLSYQITKTVTLGPSFIKCSVKDTGVSEDTVYRIVITEQSNLANSQHIIEFDVYQDDVLQDSFVKNIKQESVFPLNAVHSVTFNSEIPYLVGETFNILLSQFSRLGTTKTQLFNTIIESKVIENPEVTSHRLSQEQIIEFYQNSEWGKEFNTEYVPPVGTTAINASFQFMYPNKIRISFDKEILKSSITTSFISADISYAFGNYLLTNMGLYDETKKYVITYKVVDKTPTTTQRIDLVIDEDTASLVPQDQILIIQEAV